MSTQTVEQIQRLAPFLEGLEKRLLGTAFGEFSGATQTAPGLLDTPLNLPQQQVAGLDPLQQQAFAMAPGMVGSYAPFVMGASGQTLGGQAALGGGLGLLWEREGVRSQTHILFYGLVQFKQKNHCLFVDPAHTAVNTHNASSYSNKSIKLSKF